MSARIAVWIDSSEAKIFKFKPEGMETLHLKPHGHSHHAEVHGKNHTKHEGDNEKFLHEVAQLLTSEKDSKWYIMGPGLVHTHLCNHLKSHHGHSAAQILGNEPADHASDAQLAAKAREFFKKVDLFVD